MGIAFNSIVDPMIRVVSFVFVQFYSKFVNIMLWGFLGEDLAFDPCFDGATLLPAFKRVGDICLIPQLYLGGCAAVEARPRRWASGDPGVDDIISRMHSYRTDLGGFVDREKEAREILEWGFGKPIRGGRITVLYGPKGCGKSTFFRALSTAIDQVDARLDVMVVRKPEEATRVSFLHLPKSFRDLARDIAGHVAEGFKISSAEPSIEFTSTPTYIAWKIASYIAYIFEKGRDVLVVVDEVKADSKEHLSNFRQWLESFANDIAEYNRKYSEKGGSIAVIALTSDALVREIRHMVGDKVSWALIWNLARVSSVELASQIGLQHRVAGELGVDAEKAMEILWRLAGGNPRELEQIWGGGLRKWIENKVIDGIQSFTQDLSKKMRNKALEEISASLDRVDDIGWAEPSIWKAMLRHNIIIYIAAADKISELPREPWIGSRFAFQIPAYYYALKIATRKRSWDISPEEVIREVVG